MPALISYLYRTIFKNTQNQRIMDITKDTFNLKEKKADVIFTGIVFLSMGLLLLLSVDLLPQFMADLTNYLEHLIAQCKNPDFYY